MNIFNLPDLGEGLPDAEISEWHVKVGDTVAVDQPLVAMETAKAVVEVPSPMAGVIHKLYGQVGDIIITGAPLVEFESSGQVATPSKDTGTVVGNIETSEQVLEEHFTVGSSQSGLNTAINASASVQALAAKLGVDIASLRSPRQDGLISALDVQQAATGRPEARSTTATPKAGYEPVRGPRRSMASTMSLSHREVVPVSLMDDADIHAWAPNTDITVRLIQALITACKTEPALNAWYDGASNARKLHSDVNLGIAMDTGVALFVPVIKTAEQKSAESLRADVDRFKTLVRDREIPPEDLQGATITLSNFGNFAGRYASPIIVPPTVAIIGVGKLRDAVVAHNGLAAVHRIIPLSVTFDHRVITGGEAARFLGAMIGALEQA
jgi:2-oxoisovalerate dehydrogenase E2 component (dihydrolipoyl transacylase)